MLGHWGAKIGRVLEVGKAIMNYKRVRINFPLANPFMSVVCQKVRDKGEMMFKVRYENVPNFCFGCGHIGHAQEDCPDENLTKGGVIFAKALRGKGTSLFSAKERGRKKHDNPFW